MDSFRNLKRETLNKRLADLLKEYEAANNQLSRSLSDVDRLRIQRQIKELEKQIQQVESELNSEGAPAALPPELQQALQSSLAWMRQGAVSELERLLRGDNKNLSLSARRALERLADDDSRRVSAAANRVLGVSPATIPAEPSPTPAPPAPAKAKPKPAPDRLTITSPIHLELVRIPAGEFLMGSDPAQEKNAYDDEQPQHRVYLSEFYIGKYPVTNEQYAAFVRATKHESPDHWKRGRIPSGKKNHPVEWVSWKDAATFCEWLSRESNQAFRLPTEAEWEKAARGVDGRLYPWGNEWDPAKLNSEEGGAGDTTPVGRYSPGGDSPYKAVDMSGNVWEWGADWYEKQEYRRRAGSIVKDPQGPKEGSYYVVRGGSYLLEHSFARCAARYFSRYGWGDWSSGFRVAWAAALSL